MGSHREQHPKYFIVLPFIASSIMQWKLVARACMCQSLLKMAAIQKKRKVRTVKLSKALTDMSKTPIQVIMLQFGLC